MKNTVREVHAICPGSGIIRQLSLRLTTYRAPPDHYGAVCVCEVVRLEALAVKGHPVDAFVRLAEAVHLTQQLLSGALQRALLGHLPAVHDETHTCGCVRSWAQ